MHAGEIGFEKEKGRKKKPPQKTKTGELKCKSFTGGFSCVRVGGGGCCSFW
jgi:hypothetical protein